MSATVRIEAALDAIDRERLRLLTHGATARRSMRLADLADAEAEWWGVLFEHSRARAQWRAALAAREAARRTAAQWRRLAARQIAREITGGAA